MRHPQHYALNALNDGLKEPPKEKAEMRASPNAANSRGPVSYASNPLTAGVAVVSRSAQAAG